jgi:hypothetical protein
MEEKKVFEFNLALNLDEVNVVLSALAAGQYSVVTDLIAKIRAQALGQMPQEPPVEVADEVVDE